MIQPFSLANGDVELMLAFFRPTTDCWRGGDDGLCMMAAADGGRRTVIYFQNFGLIAVFEVILLIYEFQAHH